MTESNKSEQRDFTHTTERKRAFLTFLRALLLLLLRPGILGCQHLHGPPRHQPLKEGSSPAKTVRSFSRRPLTAVAAAAKKSPVAPFALQKSPAGRRERAPKKCFFFMRWSAGSTPVDQLFFFFHGELLERGSTSVHWRFGQGKTWELFMSFRVISGTLFWANKKSVGPGVNSEIRELQKSLRFPWSL